MKTIGKALLAVLTLAVVAFVGNLWYQTFLVGELYQHSDPFWGTVLWSVPILLVICAYFAFKSIQSLSLLVVCVAAFAFSGCNYAHSNVQTLVTHDCGVSWELIKPGQSIPKGIGNYCFRTVTIPDYPMDGESHFKSNFKNNVKAAIDLDYTYRIIDGMKFIGEAKYIGSNSQDADTKANDKQFEVAENVVIDKRIRDVARDMLLEHDIVDFSRPTSRTNFCPRSTRNCSHWV